MHPNIHIHTNLHGLTHRSNHSAIRCGCWLLGLVFSVVGMGWEDGDKFDFCLVNDMKYATRACATGCHTKPHRVRPCHTLPQRASYLMPLMGCIRLSRLSIIADSSPDDRIDFHLFCNNHLIPWSVPWNVRVGYASCIWWKANLQLIMCICNCLSVYLNI